MMWKWACVAALAAAIGCDNTNTDGAKDAQSAGPGAEQAREQSEAAGAAMSETMPASAPTYSGPGTPTYLPTTRPAEVAASEVVDSAAAGGQQTASQVQEKIDQAMQYVKENKYDLAEKTLATLEKSRTAWSPELQQQFGPKLDMARKALNAAKSGGGALDSLRGSLPGSTNQ